LSARTGSARPVFAALITLSAVTAPGGSTGLSFKLPYSTGTHRGEARQVTGKVSYDPANPGKVTGTFVIPIASIESGNDKRDCHMREALGLDYTKSEFPKEHVCDDANKLPASGRNAVVYPEIKFEVTGMSGAKGSAVNLDHESQVEIDGKWTIHGVTREARLPMTLTPDGSGFRLSGKAPLSLKSFGVEVKSAHILVVTISVDDEVTVLFDLRLSK
jgi:polyisoprenoid-binding protein YceI